jgi:hypothetical protein
MHWGMFRWDTQLNVFGTLELALRKVQIPYFIRREF